MEAMPTYYMQCRDLPSSTCRDLDRISRNFLWGEIENEKKVHPLGWDKVTRNKEEGGLGLKPTKLRNKANLTKLGWRLIREKDKIWAKVLMNKYVLTRTSSKPKQSCSVTWRALRKVSPIVQKGLRWIAHDGRSIDFWADDWTGFGSPRNMVYGPIPKQLNNITLKNMKDILEREGPSATSFPFASEILKHVTSTPLSNLSTTGDQLAWRGTEDGNFSVNSVYSILREDQGMNSNPKLWNSIWKLDTLPKINFFLWQASNKALLTRYLLHSRSIIASPFCPLCISENETIEHLLFECSFSKQKWQQIDPSRTLFNYESQNWEICILKNISATNYFGGPRIPLRIIFAFMIWHIWLFRNRVILDGPSAKPFSVHVVLEKAAEFYAVAGNVRVKPIMKQMQVAWSPPPAGWVKLNTDGASKGNPGVGGAGFVLRDANGQWMVGAYRHLPQISSFQAELWALRDGLLIAQQLNIEKLIIEMDAKAVVDLINNKDYSNANLLTLLLDCRILLDGLREWKLGHVFREGNRSADAMANLGCDAVMDILLDSSSDYEPSMGNSRCFGVVMPNLYGFYICLNPPANVLPIVDADAKGEPVVRLIK